jgi:hypothetical protein
MQSAMGQTENRGHALVIYNTWEAYYILKFWLKGVESIERKGLI